MGFFASAVAATSCFFVAMSTVQCQETPTGGWTAITDKNSQDFLSLLAFAESELAKGIGANGQRYVVVKVLEAEQQLVVGTNFFLDLELAALRSGANPSSSSCSIDHSQAYARCSIELFQPFGGPFEVKDRSCVL